jgi:gamma-glutamylcyclotransferase (GGCT)/AIG2-like uncharacterized protein YtfP
MENLFSYGTLQLVSVQQDTFGRLLNGFNDSLIGFKLTYITITDEAVLASSGQKEHPIIHYTSNTTDAIKGMVFEITEQELQQADMYEVADYKRIAVTLASGKSAWVYVSKDVEI